MPNIMMIGFDGSEYEEKKAIIDATMQKLGLGDDAVTTHFGRNNVDSRIGCLVTSCCGQRINSPYIVVRSTGGMKEIDMIIAALKANNIGVDCEKQSLPENGFIEANDMRS
ncbi:hypothetical protein HOB10_01095 [Candidatus Parcubacteria bacterium]|jgi:hypothetical protein|nr:hypothetical protein [Candidatus Parcubacteria bacterium]